jgi:hypothetical protein
MFGAGTGCRRMRRSSTPVSRLFEVAAFLAGPLIGCLSGETIDLGSNYAEAGAPGSDGDSTVVPDSGAEGAPQDAPSQDDPLPFDAADEGEADSPVTVGAPICIPNPSFEIFSGDAAGSPLLTNPQDWQACSGGPANPQACMLPPTDGDTYLALSIGLAPFVLNPASVDSLLCEPLAAGVTYSLSVELALDAPGNDASPPGEPPALQLRGSSTACDPQADLLVRFSGATNTCGWKSLCATFVPQQPYSHLVLIPEATSSTGLVFSQTNVLVDDLRSGGACPPR